MPTDIPQGGWFSPGQRVMLILYGFGMFFGVGAKCDSEAKYREQQRQIDILKAERVQHHGSK